MRTRAALLTVVIVALGSAALAQRPAPARRAAGATTARDGGAASSTDASTTATPAPTAAAASGDGGAAEPTAALTPNSFNIPMVQRGTGTIVHYPIPEQLARTDVPVFVQVSSSAPIDHVSMFYRGQGGSRFREVRMTSMGGGTLQLAGGYGASIPCEDAFPPSVEYYVSAIDTSGTPIGTAGTVTAPISMPIVRERTQQFIPTLPGQAQPRSCGTLGTTVAATGTTGAGTRGRDAGAAPEVVGTADLGEPCQRNNECRRGLRCGTSHACVFINAQQH